VSSRRPGLSLRVTLIGGAILMLTVVLVALEVPLAVTIQHREISDFRSRASSEAAFLSGQISDPVARAAEIVQEAPHPGQSIALAVAATVQSTHGDVLVVDRQQRVLADSTGAHPAGRRLDPAPADVRRTLAATDVRPVTIVSDNGSNLTVTVPVVEGGEVVGAVRLGQSLSSVHARVASGRWRLAVGGGLALLGGALLAALLATTLVRPVRRLEEAANRLGAGDLDARADASRLRELASLAQSFNTMADDLSANVQAQRDFAANASHHFKTPLTGLKLSLEGVLTDHGEPREAARKALQQVDRLDLLAQDLLRLAQASSRSAAGEPVDLGDIAATVVERWSETARRAGKPLVLDADTPGRVRSDPADVEQMLDNLVDNAIRYSDNGATVTVHATGSTVGVEDSGPGLTAEDRGRVLERFYRGGRARQIRGTGLGLPIVAELAGRWRAELVIATAPGARFDIRFPPLPGG
jgi:signal transduction histidine kinase